MKLLVSMKYSVIIMLVFFVVSCGGHKRISTIRTDLGKNEYIGFLNQKLTSSGYTSNGDKYWENGRKRVHVVSITEAEKGLLEVTLNTINFDEKVDFFIPHD